MKSLLVVLLFGIVQPPAFNMHPFDALNVQMIKDYNVARVTMLNSLTPAHRQLLGSIAARLATTVPADFAGAARKLDADLSPTEKARIKAAYETEHDGLRAIMRKAPFSALHASMVLHVGPPELGASAGHLLLYNALNLGPPQMNVIAIMH